MVVSDRFWKTRLDAAPDVVGRTVRVNGQVVTIVGIGPVEFRGVPSAFHWALAGRSAALLDRMQDRLPELAQVVSLTWAASPPFASLAVTPNYRVSVGAATSTRVQHALLRQRVGAGYFATLGIPVVRGREFDERDQMVERGRSDPHETPVVLNEAAATQLFPDGDPIGRQIRADEVVVPAFQFELGAPSTQGDSVDDGIFTVVGVSQNVKSAFLNADAVPTMFWPITDDSFARSRPWGRRSSPGLHPGRTRSGRCVKSYGCYFPI